MATTISPTAQRGCRLRQRSVLVLQLGEGDITTVPRVDIKDDLAGLWPDTDPVVGMVGPVLVSPLDVGAGVVEPMAQQSALPVTVADFRALPGGAGWPRRGTCFAGSAGWLQIHVHGRQRRP